MDVSVPCREFDNKATFDLDYSGKKLISANPSY